MGDGSGWVLALWIDRPRSRERVAHTSRKLICGVNSCPHGESVGMVSFRCGIRSTGLSPKNEVGVDNFSRWRSRKSCRPLQTTRPQLRGGPTVRGKSKVFFIGSPPWLHLHSGGLRSPQSVACSYAWARRNRVVSSKALPAICKPIGKPDAVNPQLMDKRRQVREIERGGEAATALESGDHVRLGSQAGGLGYERRRDGRSPAMISASTSSSAPTIWRRSSSRRRMDF